MVNKINTTNPQCCKVSEFSGYQTNYFKYSEIVRGHYSVTCSSLVLFFAINQSFALKPPASPTVKLLVHYL